jgi:hypothetical protein
VFAAFRKASGRIEEHALNYRLEKFEREITGNFVAPLDGGDPHWLIEFFLCLCTSVPGARGSTGFKDPDPPMIVNSRKNYPI